MQTCDWSHAIPNKSETFNLDLMFSLYSDSAFKILSHTIFLISAGAIESSLEVVTDTKI